MAGDWHCRGPIDVTAENLIPPADISLARIEREHERLVESGLRITFSGLVPEGQKMAGWWRICATDAPLAEGEEQAVMHYDAEAVAQAKRADAERRARSTGGAS